MKILNTTDSLKALTERLQHSDNVTYTRFGDGDVFLTHGKNHGGKNFYNKKTGINQFPFNESLQNDLREALKIIDENYMIAMTGCYDREQGMDRDILEPFRFCSKIEHIIVQYCNREVFYNPVLFHYLALFKHNVFRDFIDKYVKPHKKFFIGSTPKEIAEKMIGHIDYYIQVPPNGVFNNVDKWYPKILEIYYHEDFKVMIPNCGYATRVIQKRLWLENKRNIWNIDIGSVFDSLWNNQSRTWLRKKGDCIAKKYT